MAFLISVALLFAVVYIFVLLNMHLNATDVLRLGSGRTYPYEIGDWLKSSRGTFSGARIHLPKVLPHIYLDSHGDSRVVGPEVTFNNSQRINLEGDFNTYFQLFSPKGYHTLVLSIITPDIMQALLKLHEKYDVEIHGNYLNIISKSRIKGSRQKVAELNAAINLLVGEIDHKLSSWPTENELNAGGARLEYYEEESIKLFGRYTGVARLAIYCSIAIGIGFYALAFAYWNQESAEPFVLLGMGVLFFPGVALTIAYFKHEKTK